MNPLHTSDFPAFFREGHGYDPFPWQTALAERACRGDWPAYLALPTGSGKTTAIDIAVFALATQAHLPVQKRTVGRRIFFVVNRRIIVDEAFDNAKRLAKALQAPAPEQSTLQRVADALNSLKCDAERCASPPLDCVQLRGAVYRDNQWARSLTQPIVVASTVDQIGSRLLFRGYGLSAGAHPLHAALVAHDSLILLDEAHISRPFAETLLAVKRFRDYVDPIQLRQEIVRTPFNFVQVTATPPKEIESNTDAVFRLVEKDREHRILRPRLLAQKVARLVLSKKAKGKKATQALSDELKKQALNIIQHRRPNSIAVMVNRVATARETARLLAEKLGQDHVQLLIGRMRPLDRDVVTETLSKELKMKVLLSPSPISKDVDQAPRVVVATQCLEVGADFDFETLVAECASLDALRQRFGRLNRSGRITDVEAAIVMRTDLVEESEKKLQEADTKGKPLDPVYGNAMSRTWNWLREIAVDGTIDFGIASMDAKVQELRTQNTEHFNLLLSPTASAPTLFPAYLDAWVQTNPAPVPEPELALFLHGCAGGQPEVQVCWRADLPDASSELESWVQTVSLCPPSAIECLNLPLHVFRSWLFASTDEEDSSGDLLTTAASLDVIEDKKETSRCNALVWKGLTKSQLIKRPKDLRPGDTIILPVTAGGWSHLGHLPDAPFDPAVLTEKEGGPSNQELVKLDCGDEAFRKSRDRDILRVRDEFLPDVPKESVLADLLDWAKNPESDWTISDLRDCLAAAAQELKKTWEKPRDQGKCLETLLNLKTRKFGLVITRYPDGKGAVLQNKRRIYKFASQFWIPQLDDEDEALSFNPSVDAVFLRNHLRHVEEAVQKICQALPVKPWRETLIATARAHDWGKLDERFQALLLRGNRNAVWASPEPLAKSSRLSLTFHEREAARKNAGLPLGFRHEMLSVQLAEVAADAAGIPDSEELRDLSLHLIGSHHGWARPFAPIVLDEDPPEVTTFSDRQLPALHLSHISRKKWVPHRLDSGLAERFWRLTRRHGWWGLAYLEAILRLADQQVSAAEADGKYTHESEFATTPP